MENNQNTTTETCSTTENIPIHERTKLFIGGLSTKTTLDSFEAYFEKFGKVKDAFVTRGFGFVTFFDEETARAILDHTEHFIDGKAVDAKPALNRHLNPMREKLFVGGIPTDLTTEELIAVFSKWGTVSDAHVMKDGNCGKNRGFGFVCFVSREATRRVLNERCIVVRNKIVEIKPAELQSKREQHAPEAQEHSFHSEAPFSFPQQHPADAHYFYAQEPKQQAKKRRFSQRREHTRQREHSERAEYSRHPNRVPCEYYPMHFEPAEYARQFEHAEYARQFKNGEYAGQYKHPKHGEYPKHSDHPKHGEYPKHFKHAEYSNYPLPPEYAHFQHPEYANYSQLPMHSPRSMPSQHSHHSHNSMLAQQLAHFQYPQPGHHHNYAHYTTPQAHIHSVEPLYYAPNLACFSPIMSSGPDSDSESQTPDYESHSQYSSEEGEISQSFPEPQQLAKRVKAHH